MSLRGYPASVGCAVLTLLNATIPHAAKAETLASRLPSGCGFLIAAGYPWPHGTRLA